MIIASNIATPAMIDTAKELIGIGFRTRGAIVDHLRSFYGANIAQATDAIRAARLSLPFNTSYLCA